MKDRFLTLYEKLPIPIQNQVMSIYGSILGKKRYGKYYRKMLDILDSINYKDIDELKLIQNQRFIDFINFAKDNSPYYSEAFKDIDLSGIKSVEDIRRLPILEKETLRANTDRFFTVDKKGAIVSNTGGTTGKSLQVYYTKKDFQKRMAVLHHWEKEHGVMQGYRRASFNGRQFISRSQKEKVFWRYNSYRKQMLYSTFDLSEENLPFYIDSLNEFKPQVINGFVSAIYEVATYINNNDIKLSFSPIAVFTTSETLLSYHREAIEKAFGCPVRNQYASAEGAPFITECRCGKLHYNILTGVIESLYSVYGNEMLVTGFDTHGTPLIRYRIGDMWEPSDESCDCGSALPVVKKVEGRQVDYLLSKKGEKVSLSHLADVIKGLPNTVVSMQFIQNDTDKIIIKIVPDKKRFCKEDEQAILEEMKYRFGEDMGFVVEKVDSIPKEASGKYRLIKNNIKD